MKNKTTIITLVLAGSLATSCMGGGDYKFDTVIFRPAGKIPPAAGPAPGIHIDTNMQVSGLMGGTVKTSKPYSIGIDYTDVTFTFAEIEFTEVTVTYADGTTDPGAAALKMPLRIQARPYEAVNSVAGGAIVKTRMRVISGNIPGAINRDMAFTLRLEGKLVKDDGSRIPFTIKRAYDVVTDKSTRPWAEVMRDS